MKNFLQPIIQMSFNWINFGFDFKIWKQIEEQVEKGNKNQFEIKNGLRLGNKKKIK